MGSLFCLFSYKHVIMKYAVIYSNDSVGDIIQKVSESISEGWKPIGGICVTSFDFKIGHGADLIYMQSMIKE